VITIFGICHAKSVDMIPAEASHQKREIKPVGNAETLFVEIIQKER